MNSDSLEVLTHKLESLHQDVGEIKAGLTKLSDAVVQLALVEERLATSQASLARAFAAIERIEGRLLVLEQDRPQNTAMVRRVESAVWAAAAIVAVFVLRKAGVM